jgi:hypothetical protein
LFVFSPAYPPLILSQNTNTHTCTPLSLLDSGTDRAFCDMISDISRLQAQAMAVVQPHKHRSSVIAVSRLTSLFLTSPPIVRPCYLTSADPARRFRQVFPYLSPAKALFSKGFPTYSPQVGNDTSPKNQEQGEEHKTPDSKRRPGIPSS